jgi:hypothetical protein
VLGIFGGAIAGLVYAKYGNQGFTNAKVIILVLNTVYAMLFLVFLLAYGLFFLPVYLWKNGDNKAILYRELERAHFTYK